MRYGFGIDLGGTTVKLAYFDESGKMLDKWEIPTRIQEDGKYILPDIADSVSDYMRAHAIPRDAILGLGICVPGPVDADGVVNRCHNLGWGVFNVRRRLEEMTGFPVCAGNDATAAALGECWQGGGRNCEDLVMITLGTGVGGGIVSGGRVIHGAHGSAGEIGHMVINRKETEACTCGNYGCAEQYCSATGIVRMAHKRLAADGTPSCLRAIEDFTCKDVFDAAKAGDALAGQVLEQVYAYLGELAANVCNVINPETVVLGGGVSRAGKPLLSGTERYFAKHVFDGAKNVRFALAELGNDAGAYGAFKLVLDSRK